MKPKISEKGVSLVEIIIALAITAYVIMGFARMFINSNAALNSARMRTMAYNWAADQMEELRTRYYSDISTGTWTSSPQVLGERKEFTRTVTVAENNPGIKEIDIEVFWQELGTEQKVWIVSYIADY